MLEQLVCEQSKDGVGVDPYLSESLESVLRSVSVTELLIQNSFGPQGDSNVLLPSSASLAPQVTVMATQNSSRQDTLRKTKYITKTIRYSKR